MKIALDVLGGDFAPMANIEGAITYLTEYGNTASDLILVGDEKVINSKLETLSFNSSKISIEHTTELVEMHEKPARIFKEKPNSSLVKSIQLVKERKVDAAVSSGNTGALLATSLFLIGKIPGIIRPAFAPFIPTNKGGFILCDAGANANSKPQHLLQFALMAEAYIEHLEKKINPRIGLLNIGVEKNKGNELSQSTYPLLEKHIDNFIGNIESRYLFEGKVDVVICDGFTGNIVLKLIEGIISHLFEWIENLYTTHENGTNLSSEFLSILKEIQNNLDHEEYGATPLLGINGVIMKSHGASSSRGIHNSLIATQKSIEENLTNDIAKRLTIQADIIDSKQNETNPV